MLSSLVPGGLYLTPGLNKNATPTPPGITPGELDELYERQDFDGRPWPFDSPEHGVYDIKRTSTKLILLNNKNAQKYTRLRGYCITSRDRQIDTQRHFRGTSPINVRRHTRCFEGSSPTYDADTDTDYEWLDSTSVESDSYQSLGSSKLSVSTRHFQTRGQNRDKQSPTIRGLNKTSLPPNRYLRQISAVMTKDKLYSLDTDKAYSVESKKSLLLKEERSTTLPKLEAKKGQVNILKDYDRYYMKYIQNTLSRHDANSPASFRAQVELANRAEVIAELTESVTSEDQENGSKTEEDRTEKIADKMTDTTKANIQKVEKQVAKNTTSPQSKKLPELPKTQPTATTRAKRRQKRIQSQKAPTPFTSLSSISSQSSMSDTDSIVSQDRLKVKGDYIIGLEIIQPKDTIEGADTGLPHHKEGRDRPKSRLGRPIIDKVNTDKDMDLLELPESSDSSLNYSIANLMERIANEPVSSDKVTTDRDPDLLCIPGSSDSSLNYSITNLMKRITEKYSSDEENDSDVVTLDTTLDNFIEHVINRAATALKEEEELKAMKANDMDEDRSHSRISTLSQQSSNSLWTSSQENSTSSYESIPASDMFFKQALLR